MRFFLTICICAAPAAPAIIPEECSAENNSVTVAWQPPPHSHVEGYVLELDDGNGGDFRVSNLAFFFGNNVKEEIKKRDPSSSHLPLSCTLSGSIYAFSVAF